MTTYENEILDFRKRHEASQVASPRNWLNLAGLFWLQKGDNSFGSDPANNIALPSGPARAGCFHFDGRSVTLTPEAGAPLSSLNRPLRTDRDPNPDFLELDSLFLTVIQRGDNFLLRVWDTNAPAYKNFSGLNWYPINADNHVKARWIPYDPPRKIQTMDGIGTLEEGQFLGRAEFTLHGKELSLQAEPSGDLMRFNFHDLTCGKTSYGAGRQVRVPRPTGDELILDFNRSQNWPCAYTNFATCPLPPQENKLPIPIEAGEMKFHE